MALARTVVGIYSKKEAGTAAFATEEFTPPANSLLVVRVYVMRKEGESLMGTPLISGAGLTYTHRSGATTQLKPSWSTTAAWFTAPVGGSPAKMAITVDEASNLSVYEYVVSVIAYTGYDTTTPIGGLLTSGTTDIGDGEESRELSAAPAEGDETLVCIDGDSTKAPLKTSFETGWTLVHEKSASNESGIAIAQRTASTSKTVKVKDSYVGGGSFSKAAMGAIVIRAATGTLFTLELTDSVAISDSISKGVGKAQADAVGISDTIAKLTSRPLADSVAIADAIAKKPGKAIADQVDIADQVTKATGKAAADSVPISDALGKQVGKQLADSVPISDSIAKRVGRTLTDAVAIADAIARRVGKAIADALGISDLLEPKVPKAPTSIDEPTGLVLFAGAELEVEPATGSTDLGTEQSDVAIDPGAELELDPGAGLVFEDRNTEVDLSDPDAELDLDG